MGPAEKGGFEAAIAKADPKAGVEEGQTRQHARLLYLLGVDQIIVGINKMDACNWDEGRFNEIKDEFQKMLQLIGFKPKKIPFIPYSGFHGDNLVDKSDKASWYKGWSANITPKKGDRIHGGGSAQRLHQAPQASPRTSCSSPHLQHLQH